jgi:hypothetical protein
VIGWFRAWLARLVALGGQLAGALVAGILAALRAPLHPPGNKKEDRAP